MDDLWKQTRNAIRTALHRLDEIGGCFEFMWIAYRDYDVSATDLVQKSAWTDNASELEKFLDHVRCDGGYGDGAEAVEAGLREARLQHVQGQVSGIILIGDDVPRERVVERSYFQCRMETDYHAETLQLRELGVPVFSFRVP